MGKRIVILGKVARPEAPEKRSEEPGKERRQRPRRSGLPRRIRPDRRNRRGALGPQERRVGIRRSVTDRRRQRSGDRRFGLDPTLYDKLSELDL